MNMHVATETAVQCLVRLELRKLGLVRITTKALGNMAAFLPVSVVTAEISVVHLASSSDPCLPPFKAYATVYGQGQRGGGFVWAKKAGQNI